MLTTEKGDIELQIGSKEAPITAANFLRYVQEGFYDGGRFHRAVRLDNQRRSDILIEVIQGGVNPERSRDRYPTIVLERTNVTGLKHVDGAISMARGEPDSGHSDFFICIGDQPSLDFGGKRNRDGQGFAVFGRVVKGMDVVRTIQGSPTRGESLRPPIKITSARQLPR